LPAGGDAAEVKASEGGIRHPALRPVEGVTRLLAERASNLSLIARVLASEKSKSNTPGPGTSGKVRLALPIVNEAGSLNRLVSNQRLSTASKRFAGATFPGNAVRR
jgi:hypothetical protein